MATMPAAPDMGEPISSLSATRRARLYLLTPKKAIAVTATGGVPSLEKAIGDPEVSGVSSWTDAPGDAPWERPQAHDVLRAMDPSPDSAGP